MIEGGSTVWEGGRGEKGWGGSDVREEGHGGMLDLGRGWEAKG